MAASGLGQQVLVVVESDVEVPPHSRGLHAVDSLALQSVHVQRPINLQHTEPPQPVFELSKLLRRQSRSSSACPSGFAGLVWLAEVVEARFGFVAEVEVFETAPRVSRIRAMARLRSSFVAVPALTFARISLISMR